MLNPLPLRVTPVARETFPSFLARMAAVNGVTAQDFAVDMGFTLRKIIELDETAIQNLADRGGLDAKGIEELISWTGQAVGNVRMAFRGEVFVSRALRNPRVRGCPVCLREDAEVHGGGPAAGMAMRGDWQLREVSLCIQHHHPLVQLWKTGPPTQRYDISARLAEIRDRIVSGDLDQTRVTPSPYDIWLDRRLDDVRDDTWLADVSLYAATTFCRLLGTELLRLDEVRESDDAENTRAAQAAGFAVVQDGENAIRSALSELADLATGANDEPAKAFGELYTKLSRHYVNEDGFALFRDLLRERILGIWQLSLPRTSWLGRCNRNVSFTRFRARPARSVSGLS